MGTGCIIFCISLLSWTELISLLPLPSRTGRRLPVTYLLSDGGSLACCCCCGTSAQAASNAPSATSTMYRFILFLSVARNGEPEVYLLRRRGANLIPRYGPALPARAQQPQVSHATHGVAVEGCFWLARVVPPDEYSMATDDIPYIAAPALAGAAC